MVFFLLVAVVFRGRLGSEGRGHGPEAASGGTCCRCRAYPATPAATTAADAAISEAQTGRCGPVGRHGGAERWLQQPSELLGSHGGEGPGGGGGFVWMVETSYAP